jgi:hypothetical protein
MSPRFGMSAPAAVALGLVGLLSLAACHSRRKAERKGPFLSILNRETTSVTHVGVSPESIALALGGLPPEEMTRLRRRLEESGDAAIRRAAPALFDLELDEDDAGPPPDPLRQALPDVPALTAAENLLGAPWHAPGLSVDLGPTCEVAASRCMPLFVRAIDPGDDMVRRGRALAWTLTNAAVLQVSPSARDARLRSLRRAQARPSSTIALVFGATRGALDETELELLRDQARRALGHAAPGAPGRRWLEALSAAPSDWQLPIALGTDEVLVVPRLGAMARLHDFHSEVDLAVEEK